MGVVPEPASASRPKRWVAVLLSLLCVGAGQFYCGFLKRAILFFSLGMASMLVIGFALAHAPSSAGFDYLAVIFPLLFQLGTTWDAHRCARKREARRSKFLPVLGFILLVVFLPGQISTDRLSAYTFPVRSYYIPSGNMMPTLTTGDYILVRMVPFQPKRGDVVVFEPPDTYHGNNEQLVDRIVAVGGDEIEIKQGALWLNGARQDEPYILEPAHDDFGKFCVPDGQLFMMGDNRNDSFDSRYWRAVPLDHLKGRVMSIYWSRQSGRVGRAL